MDIYCANCGEPFSVGNDTIEDINLAKNGKCIVCKGDRNKAEVPEGSGLTRSEATSALADVLGDDVDGIASMLDDFGF